MQQVAREDLRRYRGLVTAQKQIVEKIEILNATFENLNSASIRDVPIKNGGEGVDDRLLSNIVERQKLEQQREMNERVIGWIEFGLRNLTKNERFLLEVFYITPTRNSAQIAMNKLNYSKTHVYRLRDCALKKFVLYQYGLMEQ